MRRQLKSAGKLYELFGNLRNALVSTLMLSPIYKSILAIHINFDSRYKLCTIVFAQGIRTKHVQKVLFLHIN